MDAKSFWKLFLDTGAPEAYLLYNMAKKSEAEDVSDDQGSGAAGVGLQ